MRLEEQVCSLELARKLKELGVWQRSIWHWYDGIIVSKRPCGICLSAEDFRPVYSRGEGNLYSAFTVAELGKMLAEVKREWKHHDRVRIPTYYIGQGGTENGWDIDSPYKTTIASDKEADARAKLLAFWIENVKLIEITVSWLNK